MLADWRQASTMPGGFADADGKLPRKPSVDYSDLEPLSTIRALGPGGDVAGEFRLERSPRTSGNDFAISPSAVGWQAALADDQSARMIYVDIDLNGWGEASVQRRLGMAAQGYESPSVSPDVTTGVPSLQTALSDTWSVANHACEALYDAKGIDIGSVYYAWQHAASISAANPDWSYQVYLDEEDTFDATNRDATGNLHAAGPGTGTLTAGAGGRTFAMVQLLHAIAGGATGVSYPVFWRLAVYGNHGLTKRGTASATAAQGFYASDIVAHAVRTWAPLLTFSEGSDGTISPSGFVIEQAAFPDPTTAADIIAQALRFGLQDWAVWEDKTFWMHERGARGRKWRARVAPAQLSETGPQIDRLWNSVIVSYNDVDGTTRTVGPVGSGSNTEDDALKDADPDNPLNELGITRRSLLQMGVSTPAGATEVGRRFLEEQKLLDTSGQATLVGHVEDDRGVLCPAWRPRAGDYISFPDASDSSYRRITKADYSHSSRSCSVDLDSPPEGLASLLERLNVVLVPLGL